MDCNQVKDSLYDLAANQLDEKERVSVEEHLKECQNCRKDLLLLQDTLPILDSWEAPRLSAKTIDRMTENILNKQIPWWQRMMDRITLPPRFMLPVQALAVACLIIVVIPLFIPKEEEVISRGGLKIDVQHAGANNPIRLIVKNVPGAVSDIEGLLKRYQGNVRQRRNLAMSIGFDIDESKKEIFFSELSKIGQIEIPNHGYQNEKGIIFVVIMEK